MMREKILVVPRARIIREFGVWRGVQEIDDSRRFVALVETCGFFAERSLAEHDPTLKQIIPYTIIRCLEHIFLYQRKKTASESRLSARYSIGVGGHMRLEDARLPFPGGWVARELAEEVFYEGKMATSFVGLLNDDSDEVGQVHLGCLLLSETNSKKVLPRGEFKRGAFCGRLGLFGYVGQMENWSRLILDYILAGQL